MLPTIAARDKMTSPGVRWFNRAHEFPKPAMDDFALAPEAERTLRSGVPALQRYLPFSWANLV